MNTQAVSLGSLPATEEEEIMTGDKNEGEWPDEPEWVRDPARQTQRLVHLYLQASEDGRALMTPLFEQLGLPIPFTVARPPEHISPPMAVLALEQLLEQTALLGRENARVALGVSQIAPELGTSMITGFFLAMKPYQDLLSNIIEQLKTRAEKHAS